MSPKRTQKDNSKVAQKQINEIKTTLESLNNRLGEAEERISD